MEATVLIMAFQIILPMIFINILPFKNQKVSGIHLDGSNLGHCGRLPEHQPTHEHLSEYYNYDYDHTGQDGTTLSPDAKKNPADPIEASIPTNTTLYIVSL